LGGGGLGEQKKKKKGPRGIGGVKKKRLPRLERVQIQKKSALNSCMQGQHLWPPPQKAAENKKGHLGKTQGQWWGG